MRLHPKTLWRASGLAAVLMTVAGPGLAADSYGFDARHSSVIFYYPHFGLSRPSGKIMGASGTLVLDWDHPANSTVDVTLDLSTLATALPDFDTMLKGDGYFDIAHFPTARFKSTGVELVPDAADPTAQPHEARVTGDLSLHGKTQPVVLDVVFNKKAFNPAEFKTGVGFSATARLQRGAFGLGAYEPFVGDDIDLDIEAEAYPGVGPGVGSGAGPGVGP